MGKRLIIIGAVFALLIAAFVYYKNNYFPKYRWFPDYSTSSDQPYGLKLFYSTVKKNNKTTVLYNQAYHLLDTNQTKSNFIFIGDDFYIDSVSALCILKYVEKGNSALIASNYSPLEVLRNFVPKNDSINGFREERDSIIQVDFTGDTVPFPKKIKFHYQSFKDTMGYYWSLYRGTYFKDTLSSYSFIPISTINNSGINAFYIKHGKGKIIVHANPLLFTNYYMVRENGFEHANNMLSQLNKGLTYWDDRTNFQNNDSRNAQVNPLQFLFSHPYLKWAWYLFLITIILYLVFRSKREQRIIPIMPVNVNASVEYTKAIGTLYFQNKGHSHIANEMYIIFLSEVRARYNLSTDLPEMELIDQLSLRSGIDKTVLYNLFKQFKNLRLNQDANPDDVINLYNAIENYHKKRK